MSAQRRAEAEAFRLRQVREAGLEDAIGVAGGEEERHDPDGVAQEAGRNLFQHWPAVEQGAGGVGETAAGAERGGAEGELPTAARAAVGAEQEAGVGGTSASGLCRPRS